MYLLFSDADLKHLLSLSFFLNNLTSTRACVLANRILPPIFFYGQRLWSDLFHFIQAQANIIKITTADTENKIPFFSKLSPTISKLFSLPNAPYSMPYFPKFPNYVRNLGFN